MKRDNESAGDLERVSRELDFHNTRFATDSERAQSKYYFAIADGEQQFRGRIADLSRGVDVLEYGCSVGRNSLNLATTAKSITGIDISDVAISKAQASAVEMGFANARFCAMNAEEMNFPDASFDLIFGSGIIHHLDVEKSMREIRRVLRPDGTAIFWEPLGHNPIINTYRMLTPNARTPDEHPLRREHFGTIRQQFPRMRITYLGLLALFSVPFRKSSRALRIRKVLSHIDQSIFALGPLKWSAWYVIMELRPT